MNTITLVENSAEAQPLDETVYPRRRSRRRSLPLPARPMPTPAADEKPAAPSQAEQAAAKVPLVSTPGELDATIPPRKTSISDPSRGDVLLYLLLFGLIAGAWQISQMNLFKPSDDTGYWLGVGGGSMMLALFTYPMRKYLRFMQGWGKVKGWFWFHLCLGIGGPWLILVHSQFSIGSLNAGVALYSMGVVVASGVIGRFIYVRINRGLDGERTSLRELRQRAGLVEDAARSRLHFCPAVERRLLDFEQQELRAQPGWATHLRQVTVLPLQQWITYLRCVRELRKPLHQLATKYSWSASDLKRRKRRARRLVDQYLHAVVRVAQFTAYERVFALWHLAHLPFIYLLVISAVVHVIAVHAY
jgi:hypothetical protein